MLRGSISNWLQLGFTTNSMFIVYLIPFASVRKRYRMRLLFTLKYREIKLHVNGERQSK